MSSIPASVIIPAYNVSDSLCRTLDSVLHQDPRPAQVIVINDGSTDGTAEVARSYGDRIIYLEQENQGQGAARNAGLRAATGQFIAFLDADDYWLPGFLRTCVDFLTARTDIIAVSTGCTIKRWGKKEYLWPPMVSDHVRERDGAPIIIESFFQFWGEHDHIRTGSNVIRREIIEEAGYQRADLRISQDLEYWGYLGTFGTWVFIPVPLWVGDSQQVAASSGWLAKYRKRRRLCPTVEQWQERIVPRLRGEDWEGFRKVRGRVAASFAMTHLLCGRDEEAKHIVATYGQEMPPGWCASAMRAGLKAGGLGWKLSSLFVRGRELLKAKVMAATRRRTIRAAAALPDPARS